MPGSRITRRRAITILAATAAGLACDSSPARADYEWRGLAMGTDARIVFSAADPDAARVSAAMSSAEIERLEGALSLFREDSEISRLNRDKVLHEPSADFRRALAIGLRVAHATGGLFDPTVQALWEMYADWFAAAPDADVPPPARVAAALACVDWRTIEIAASQIRLRTTQRITLNGLGQGYVTDRIADLLRGQGFDHVLVDLGEQQALGRRADGAPWQVGLAGADDIELSNGALATSEGTGCILGANGAVHHLFDPRTGRSASHWRRVTVHHRSAAVADALSTAFSAASAGELSTMLGKMDGIALWTTDPAGKTQRWP